MNSNLETFESALKTNCAALLSSKDVPTNLSSAIEYSLLAPGKRIRPRLALATGQLLGLDSAATMPTAVAIEMVHCFTLIHDDLPCMDNDDFRRGRPSNHKVHGEGLALLAGDALLALAFEVFAQSSAHVKQAPFALALKRFVRASGASGVIGGQAAEALLSTSSSLDEVLEMHRKKTGALFEAAILVPMNLAGVAEPSAEASALSAFASAIGSAFQIADDIEDAKEESEKDEVNILSFMPEPKARAFALDALKASTQTLKNLYSSKSEPLVSIAKELEARL